MPDARVHLIRSSRLLLGEAPRWLGADSDSYLTLHRPFLQFLVPADHKKAIANLRPLLQRGTVVWGTLVVAQDALFSKGDFDGRGVVVYCPQLHLHDNLEHLVAAAQSLEELRKKQSTKEDETALQKLIEDNNAWFTPRTIPQSVVDDESLRVSSVLIARKHLPKGIVTANCLPILVHPEIETIAVLPERYWSQDMKAHWL